MSKFIIISLLLVTMLMPLIAGPDDSTQVNSPKKSATVPNPVYYGGTIGLSFGSYFRISIMPLVGYKLSPKASVGVKLGYEYVEDKRYDPKLTASNYGASIFTRYRFIPNAYAHAEFAYFSYKYKRNDFETERKWVPFSILAVDISNR